MRQNATTVGWKFGILGLVLAALTACSGTQRPADLGLIYNREAQTPGLDRNPVIVIPGILGSRLFEESSETLVWGGFSGKYANPETAEGARLIGLPMQMGVPLHALQDDVQPNGVLVSLNVKLFGINIFVDAYRNILTSLGVGQYLDPHFGAYGEVDYGEDHYTCFQFDYDWRRDNVENAQRLHAFMVEKKAIVRQKLIDEFGEDNPDLKFDIVAHSMGGLITRYYLRYGDAALPDDGSDHPITWAGAEMVERAILVATPNAGSVSALQELVEGKEFSSVLPSYSSKILGTMPALYQLLPRTRHNAVVDANGDGVDDLFDLGLWERMNWGLAGPDEDGMLATLLPTVASAEDRRAIAIDHLEKSLDRAKRFHASLDKPAAPPNGLELYLFAGDSKATMVQMKVQNNGKISLSGSEPGDGTVVRSSALMDERTPENWSRQLQTPIHWAGVRFVFADHLGLTKDAGFTDNLLYLLLEDPRTGLRGE